MTKPKLSDVIDHPGYYSQEVRDEVRQILTCQLAEAEKRLTYERANRPSYAPNRPTRRELGEAALVEITRKYLAKIKEGA